MKNKRFIAKCLTLAMVLALMIPTPVAAASSKGRLAKSITEYRWNTTKGRWEKESTTSFTYKKAYPKEIKTTYYSTIAGIPWSASMQVEKAKYKFKGKTPKSMTLKNTAGRVTEKRKYSKGRLSSATTSYRYVDDDGDATTLNAKTTATYNKKGLATKMSYNFSEATTYASGESPYNRTRSGTVTFTVTQKKGIPSLITTMETWIRNGNPGADTEPSGYVVFNKKGMATESGYFYKNSAGAQIRIPYCKVSYKMKKGRVSQAIVYTVDDVDYETGAVKKQTPSMKYTFKYNKTKIGKVRYLSMINESVLFPMNAPEDYEYGGGPEAFFSWY